MKSTMDDVSTVGAGSSPRPKFVCDLRARNIRGVLPCIRDGLAEPPGRVEPVPAPRMATRQAVHRKNEAADCPVLSNGLDGVLGARRMKAAGFRHVRGQEELVRSHHTDEEELGKPKKNGQYAAHP